MDIILPVIIVAVIGLIAGVGLSVAAIVFAVPVDEKAEAIAEVLPGANCGACGYSGCSGYAKALSEGKAENGQCAPGGAACAAKIGEILGTGGVSVEKKIAVVKCKGTFDCTENKMIYTGISSCAAAMQHFGGVSSCAYGCMGLGDCVNACPFGAIEVCNGAAHVDIEKCTGCGKCSKACPKNIIGMVPAKEANIVRCSSHDKGPVARKACKSACIGCGKCIKSCPSGAVKVENFLAVIDYDKCTGCGECSKVCPDKCIDEIVIKK